MVLYPAGSRWVLHFRFLGGFFACSFQNLQQRNCSETPLLLLLLSTDPFRGRYNGSSASISS